MALEDSVKLPYNEVYQYENGGQLHEIEYEIYPIPGSDLAEFKKVYGEKIISTNGNPVPEGYKNSFRR